MKTYNDCTAEEALNFLSIYFSTMDALYMAQKHYDALSLESTTVFERAKYRALALEAHRDIELLKNQRRAFIECRQSIHPPKPAQVEKAKALTAKLGQVIANNLAGTSVVSMATEAMTTFNRLVEA